MSGSIMVSRDLWDDAAFRDEPFSEREAWIWMIAEASWKARAKRVGQHVITLDRGQVAASVRFLADAWKWTASRVQRFLERLKKMEMIRVETDTGLSVITLSKYDEYQASPKAADTGPIQDRYRTDTNEKKGEIREECITAEKSAKPQKRKSRLSEDWSPSDRDVEFARGKGLSPQRIASEAEKFKNYHIGKGSLMLDWGRAWMTWVGNAKAWSAPSGPSPVSGKNGVHAGAFGFIPEHS